MANPTFSESYVDHVAKLEQRLNRDEALRHAVGGEFVAVGRLEYHLLRSRGLKDDHFVVDVGCGSGRLACQLAPFPGIRYVGCDVVPRLLDYARDLCGRPDWRFECTTGATIPCDDAQADFACFFSVFTHLHQEEIYRYFREAHRVLKPGGLMLMSFLEFDVPSHWATFIASVDGTRDDAHLNQFVDRNALQLWAVRSGFDILGIHAGNTDYIPLPEEITLESGARASGDATLGQSVAVLQKRMNVVEGRNTTAVLNGNANVEQTTNKSPERREDDRALPPAAPADPLINLSARTHLSRSATVTAGFTIGGSASRRVLVRAIGPSLRLFGHPTPLADPILEIYAGGTVRANCVEGWGGDNYVAAAAARVGAFALPADNRDAALVATLPPGSYTAVGKSATGTNEGEVIVEVYLID